MQKYNILLKRISFRPTILKSLSDTKEKVLNMKKNSGQFGMSNPLLLTIESIYQYPIRMNFYVSLSILIA